MTDPYNFHNFLCALSILLFIVLFLFGNKPLNVKEVFNITYIFGLISFIFFFFSYNIPQTHGERVIHWVLVVPIYILTSYKLMDNYIVKKYNRHIIFYYRSREDNKKQLWREYFFQMFLMLSCLFTFLVLHYVIK